MTAQQQFTLKQLRQGVFSCSLPDTPQYLEEIIYAFARLEDAPDTRKTHYFNGRYENIYPQREAFPEIEPLLEVIFSCARQALSTDKPLETSFWFNQMMPGHTTTLHTHDDGYELISGVCYLDVPEGSGDILLHMSDRVLNITPRAGMLLLFPPDLPHEVEQNRSSQPRLSMAFNIGPGNE